MTYSKKQEFNNIFEKATKKEKKHFKDKLSKILPYYSIALLLTIVHTLRPLTFGNQSKLSFFIKQTIADIQLRHF